MLLQEKTRGFPVGIRGSTEGSDWQPLPPGRSVQAVDLDAARLGGFGLGQAQGEQTLVEPGADPAGVDGRIHLERRAGNQPGVRLAVNDLRGLGWAAARWPTRVSSPFSKVISRPCRRHAGHLDLDDEAIGGLGDAGARTHVAARGRLWWRLVPLTGAAVVCAWEVLGWGLKTFPGRSQVGVGQPPGWVVLLDADLDLARLGGLGFGQRDGQDAVLVGGGHAGGVHRESAG